MPSMHQGVSRESNFPITSLDNTKKLADFLPPLADVGMLDDDRLIVQYQLKLWTGMASPGVEASPVELLLGSNCFADVEPFHVVCFLAG